MVDLSTEYLGLRLKNPLVPSASPLSKSLGKARQLEDAGAAAIVMYSLFEEELRVEEAMAERFLLHPELGHGEASGFLPSMGHFWNVLDRYLEQIQRLKESLDIPVIASLNGISLGGWVDLGIELQRAGADALELNVYHIAANAEDSSEAVEQRYIELLKELRHAVSLPIVMKLSPFFSSLPNFIRRLEAAGANGVALFNRFYQADIDLDSLAMADKLHLSTPDDALLRLRWIGILHGRTRLNLAATGGVHGSEEALKMLLAGADVVHLASCLLQHGPERLSEILRGIEAWMVEREYASVSQLRGSMSQRNLPDPAAYARASYVRVLDSYSPPPGVWR
ncbi:MAG: dihydroorotate dehydrogenase-like protein [Hydrogenophilaceae bacterium]|nr:dihydroorotate dehydrogenase-like protein [Hydrogenophilaceae bacterium]